MGCKDEKKSTGCATRAKENNGWASRRRTSTCLCKHEKKYHIKAVLNVQKLFCGLCECIEFKEVKQ
jgi:hypothetical protein